MAILSGHRILQYVETGGGYPGTGDCEFPMGTKWEPPITPSGPWTLVEWGVAPYGYEPFDTLTGNSVCYLAENFDDPADPSSGDWEIGVAPIAYDTDHYELQRSDVGAQILESSNSGAAVNFSSGDIRVHNIFPAHELGYMEGSNNLSDVSSVASSRTNLELGDVAVADTGTGNGLNADTLDGYHGSQYWRRAQDETISGNHTHSGDLSLSGDNDYTGLNRYSQGVFVVPAGADLWATS
jgi:hypothetical protein